MQELLIVSAFYKAFGTYKSEADHPYVFILLTVLLGRHGLLAADQLSHVYAHCVQFVDQDLVDLQLGLKLVVGLILSRVSILLAACSLWPSYFVLTCLSVINIVVRLANLLLEHFDLRVKALLSQEKLFRFVL